MPTFFSASPPDGVAVITGHVDHAIIAEEVGCVKHVDVKGVAFNPLATVKQPPEIA